VNQVILDPDFGFSDSNMKNTSFPETEIQSDYDSFKNKKAKD